MAATLAGVPVERINERAAEINVLRFVLAVLALPFMLVGWIAGRTLVALAWMAGAVLVGWEAGRTPPKHRESGG